MASGSDKTPYTHYIAIDFGTSGCGVVISTSASETPRLFSKWMASQTGVGIKCPTVLLLDHNKECEAFGLKARVNYHKKNVKHSKEFKNYYLFEHFKMNLYEEKNISHGMVIQAVDGKELLATTVFSKALSYIKDLVLSELNHEIAYPNMTILWILTVPAIWSSAAKQVMRIAAENAGFCTGSNYLKFALEPEAASLYCLDEKENDLLSAATGQHLVVDCGGGTVDIAAHKWVKLPEEKLIYAEEIHKVHGGPCGSFAINTEFEKLLIKIFKVNMPELKKECGSNWSKLIFSFFEKEKCSFNNDDCKISIQIPKKLFKYIEKTSGRNIADLVSDYKPFTIQWDKNEETLVLPPKLMCSLFDLVINQVICVIDHVLKTPECKSIKKVMMVGGFSESKILFDAIEKHFSPRLTVTTGGNPVYSVMYGALKFGKHHEMIRSHIMSQTLGIETWDDFISGKHDEKRKYTDENGKCYCTQVFTTFVQIGQSISTQKPTSQQHIFTPVPNDKNTCHLKVCGSYEKEPQYVDNICCYQVAELTLTDLPSPSSGVLQEVTVQMDVRGTEVTVTATGNTAQQKIPITIDWMKDKFRAS